MQICLPIQSLAIRDIVRDCLEKPAADRTAADIDALLDFTKHLAAFANQTQSLRRAMCSVMRYAHVADAGAIVLEDGEELDAWCVLINGHVDLELAANGQQRQQLHVGDGFGIEPTMSRQYQHGTMRTGCADCQFVCVPQLEYYRVWHQGAENTQTHKDELGRPVWVTELRPAEGMAGGVMGAVRLGHVVIRVC